jgi:5'-nucleotidase
MPKKAFDQHGRLIDAAVALATPGQTINGAAGRDTLIGTAGDDVITGGAGADLLNGGAGGGIFRYTSTRDAGDTITDFTPYADKLDLSVLLAGLGVTGNGVAIGHVKFADAISGVNLMIDTDGSAGPAVARPLVLLKGFSAKLMAPARDIVGVAAPL